MRPASHPSWFEDLREQGVANVALHLGLTPDRNGRAWRPCPLCDAEDRGDGRGPIGAVHSGGGWVCYRCGAKGDAVALAAAIATGEVRPPRSRWREVRAECAARRLCSAEAGPRVATGERRRITAVPPSLPNRPPRAEVESLWDSSRPVTEDDDAKAWFARRKRRYDIHAVADLDVMRVLRGGHRPPAWARCTGLSWEEGGWWLLTPMYEATGALVTVHARAVDPERKPKGASPAGYDIGGTVMADALARGLLRGATFGPGETVADFVAGSHGLIASASGDVRAGVLIVEGVPDFLAAACSWSEAAENLPAVFGVIAGSWSSEIAARIPDGTRVVIATDADEAGERYANQIAETLSGRCVLARWTPEEVGDG